MQKGVICVYVLTDLKVWFPFVLQCECVSWSTWREDDDDGNAHCCWHFLCWVWIHCGMEICMISFRSGWCIISKRKKKHELLFELFEWFVFFQETAHEKAQKYKEGKSVLERYVYVETRESYISVVALCVGIHWRLFEFEMNRFKVSGPDGSNYWISPEAHVVGGSDADDAWHINLNLLFQNAYSFQPLYSS